MNFVDTHTHLDSCFHGLSYLYLFHSFNQCFHVSLDQVLLVDEFMLEGFSHVFYKALSVYHAADLYNCSEHRRVREVLPQRLH